MCGIFGFITNDKSNLNSAIYNTLNGLFRLQHRGEEAAGAAVGRSDGSIKLETRLGYVGHLRDKLDTKEWQGLVAIAHTRYRTTGEASLRNAQPLRREISGDHIAIVHNGDIVSVEFDSQVFSLSKLRSKLEKQGVAFATSSDTEIIPSLIAQTDNGDMVGRIIKVLNQLQGAFSLLFIWRGHLIAARDPWGFRPLVMGKADNGYAFASETCGFSKMHIKFVREVERGEIIVISPDLEIKSIKLERQVAPAYCSFEKVYFARPDSYILGQDISDVRTDFGHTIAQEIIKQLQMENSADSLANIAMVMAVLDSGLAAGLELAYALGVRFDYGLIRNHYSGRNFIMPGQDIREQEVDLKHSVNKARIKANIRKLLESKLKAAGYPTTLKIFRVIIVIVDDSIVRGTTSKAHVSNIREEALKSLVELVTEYRDNGIIIEKFDLEIWFVSSSPQVKYSCYYGIETKNREELIAAASDTEGIRRFIGADRIFYLSLEGFKKCLKVPQDHCLACFDGNYPITIR